jgi:hypothetical protein
MKKIIIALSISLLPIVSAQTANAQPCTEILNSQGTSAVGCAEPAYPQYLHLGGVNGGAPECTVNAGVLRVNGEFYPTNTFYKHTKIKAHLNGQRIWAKYTGPTTSGGTINARFMLLPENNEYLSRLSSNSKIGISINKCRAAEIANGNWERANIFYQQTIPGYVRR